jgi:hypothetical protein
MSDEILKPGTQKRVNVFASIPVSMPHGLGEIGFSRTAPISGRQMGVMLPIEVIRICILGRAQVDECLANGGLLRLTLANYNKNNNVTKDDKQQPVVVTPLQVKNGKIVPPPVRRPTKAVNIGGINAQPIIQSQEYHMPPANDPFSDVQENGSSSDSGAEAEVSEASAAETSTVVASEVQRVVNESPVAEEEKKEEQAPVEEEAAAPIPNDPMLQMVAEAEAESKEEESEGEDEESDDQAQSTEQNSQSKKKKKKH